MNMTARQVIDQAVIQWLEREDLVRLGRAQRLAQLEHAARIWQFGKWCIIGERHGLEIRPQIKFRGSRPESTEWDAIPDISDEEGMLIHQATLQLTGLECTIIKLFYLYWCTADDVQRISRKRRQTILDLRWSGLEKIAAFLNENSA